MKVQLFKRVVHYLNEEGEDKEHVMYVTGTISDEHLQLIIGSECEIISTKNTRPTIEIPDDVVMQYIK